ncbi:MAG: hypothetical protein AAF490_21940 [Chloroflexota bacterium]
MNTQPMNASLYDLSQNTQGQLFMAMQKKFSETLEPLPPILQVRRGYAESPAWFMVQASEFAPEPLTVHNIRVRDIYASKRLVAALLEMLAGERWLARVGDAYHLTPLGKTLIGQLQERTAKVLTSTQLSISDVLVEGVEASLRQIIDASLTQLDATITWCLRYSRNRAPDDSAHPFLKLSQYFSDFNAYRDDAHMKAWQAHEPEGFIWESFAQIATQKAHDVASVFDLLYYRGYAKEEFQNGVDQLVEKEWLMSDENGRLTVTEMGQAVFEAVEKTTDELFYAPWRTFSTEFQDKTIQQLQQFHDELQAIASEE